MDVLHVIHQFPPESRGGSESYLLDVAQRQRARGMHVEVLSGSKVWRDRVMLETDDVDGLRVHRLHRDDLFFDHHAKMWHPEVEQRFSDLLASWRPALVHVHHWVRLTCNLVEICARHGVPAVVTLHDYWTSCPRAFRRRPGDEACRRVLSAASCGDCVPRYGHEPAAEIAAGIELYRDHFRAELSLARAVLVAVASTAELLSATTGVPRERYVVLPLGYRPRFAGLPALPAPAAGEPLRFAFWGGVGRHTMSCCALSAGCTPRGRGAAS
jgi:glycosyltransferase involved in cell wall biosynthesis